MIEFPDYETAVACYNSPEYQAEHQNAAAARSADIIIVEGYDGPQPDDTHARFAIPPATRRSSWLTCGWSWPAPAGAWGAR